jgi:hypothetical protein
LPYYNCNILIYIYSFVFSSIWLTLSYARNIAFFGVIFMTAVDAIIREHKNDLNVFVNLDDLDDLGNLGQKYSTR